MIHTFKYLARIVWRKPLVLNFNFVPIIGTCLAVLADTCYSNTANSSIYEISLFFRLVAWISSGHFKELHFARDCKYLAFEISIWLISLNIFIITSLNHILHKKGIQKIRFDFRTLLRNWNLTFWIWPISLSILGQLNV